LTGIKVRISTVIQKMSSYNFPMYPLQQMRNLAISGLFSIPLILLFPLPLM
jgi:hypothetical protein